MASNKEASKNHKQKQVTLIELYLPAQRRQWSIPLYTSWTCMKCKGYLICIRVNEHASLYVHIFYLLLIVQDFNSY